MSPISESNSFNSQQPEPSNWTRFWGGVKTLGGVAETIAGGGVAIASSWTGIGAVAGGGVAAHGIDTSISGLKQLISGFDERSYTSLAIENITGSENVAEIADAGIGFFGSIGGAFAKVAKGFSEITVPARWASKIWRFGELPPGVLGSTDAAGNIVIQNGLRGSELQHVIDHEMVHRALTPTGLLSETRSQIGTAGYVNSELLRFTEEAIAETAGSGSLKTGIMHPLVNGYGITAKGLATEGTVLGGIVANGEELGTELTND